MLLGPTILSEGGASLRDVITAGNTPVVITISTLPQPPRLLSPAHRHFLRCGKDWALTVRALPGEPSGRPRGILLERYLVGHHNKGGGALLAQRNTRGPLVVDDSRLCEGQVQPKGNVPEFLLTGVIRFPDRYIGSGDHL